MSGLRAAAAATLRILMLLALLTPVGLALGACDEDGPAEEAGETIDETVDEAGDKVDRATD